MRQVFRRSRSRGRNHAVLLPRLSGVVLSNACSISHYRTGSLADLDDAALIDALTGWAAAESAAAARRPAVMAEFTTRRLQDAAFADWAVDDYQAAAIDVGAALNVSHWVAADQMELAMVLRTRLPKGRCPLRRRAGQQHGRHHQRNARTWCVTPRRWRHLDTAPD